MNSRPPTLDPRPSLFPGALFFGILAVAWFFRILFLGKIYFFEDLMEFYLPLRHYYAEGLKAGELRLWYPSLGMGFPFHAEGQTGMCWLPNLLLYGLLPAQVAFRLAYPLIWYALSFFTYQFLRLWQRSQTASIIGGLVFAYGAWATTHLNHISVLNVLSLFPAAMVVLELFFRRRKAVWLVTWAALVGGQWLAGHPQYTSYCWLMYAAYFFYRLGSLEQASLRWKTLGMWGFLHGLTFLIGAVQLLPTFELVPFSIRAGGVVDKFSEMHSVPPWHFITYFFPDFFGRQTHQFDYGWWQIDGYAFEYMAYGGLLPLLLGLASLWAIKTGSPVTFFLLFSFFAHLLIIGRYAPFYEWFRGLPGMGHFKSPARLLCMVSYCWGVLAAWGWDELVRLGNNRGRLKRFRWSVAGLVAGVLAMMAGLKFWVEFGEESLREVLYTLVHWFAETQVASEFVQGRIANTISQRIGALKIMEHLDATLQWGGPVFGWQLLLLVGAAGIATLVVPIARSPSGRKLAGGRALALILLDLGVYGWNYDVPVPLEAALSMPQSIAALKGEVGDGRILTQRVPLDMPMADHKEYGSENMSLLWGVSLSKVGTPLSLFRQELFKTISVSAERQNPQGQAEALLGRYEGFRRLCNIRAAIGDRATVHFGARLLLENEVVRVWKWDGPDDLVHLIPEVRIVPTQKIIEFLWNPAINWLKVAYVEESSTKEVEPSPAGTPPGTARLIEHTWNRFQVETVSQRPAWLLISQVMYPGWRAWVNGNEQPIVATNYLFQGVPVPGGKAEVEVRFLPMTFRYGLWLTCLGTLLLTVLVTVLSVLPLAPAPEAPERQ